MQHTNKPNCTDLNDTLKNHFHKYVLRYLLHLFNYLFGLFQAIISQVMISVASPSECSVCLLLSYVFY